LVPPFLPRSMSTGSDICCLVANVTHMFGTEFSELSDRYRRVKQNKCYSRKRFVSCCELCKQRRSTIRGDWDTKFPKFVNFKIAGETVATIRKPNVEYRMLQNYFWGLNRVCRISLRRGNQMLLQFCEYQTVFAPPGATFQINVHPPLRLISGVSGVCVRENRVWPHVRDDV
jgi:hypothetical protein